MDKKTNFHATAYCISVYRKVLYLKGLDCGNCASRIENIAKKELNHEKIVVDFATTRFIIETTDKDFIDKTYIIIKRGNKNYYVGKKN